MELTLSILLPQTTDITHLNLAKGEYEWNGKMYPQGFAKSDFKNNWTIEETPVADYLLKQLPVKFSKIEWKCLSIRGDGLEEYVQGIIDSESDIAEDSTLAEIFDNTIDLSQDWAVIFEINDNPIGKLYYDTTENLKSKVQERLVEGESFIAVMLHGSVA